MSADVTKMLKKIEADKVKFIRLQFTDIQGMPKNVSIPAIHELAVPVNYTNYTTHIITENDNPLY